MRFDLRSWNMDDKDFRNQLIWNKGELVKTLYSWKMQPLGKQLGIIFGLGTEIGYHWNQQTN